MDACIVKLSTLALALVLGLATPASACSTCSTGDPSLTLMGTEPPYAGRVRFFGEIQYRWTEVPRADRPSDAHEGQLSLGASWAPSDRITLALTLPTILRRVERGPHGAATVLGPGDLEVRSRWILLRDRSFGPSHLLGLRAGLKLPTSVDQVSPQGTLLPVDAQTGTGTIDPIVGFFYSHFADPVAFFASAEVRVPTAGRYSQSPGPSLQGAIALQYRFDRRITLRGAVEARMDAPARVDERTDPASDHFVLFASPDLLWSPLPDLVVVVGVRIPTLQFSEQQRNERIYARCALVLDLS